METVSADTPVDEGDFVRVEVKLYHSTDGNPQIPAGRPGIITVVAKSDPDNKYLIELHDKLTVRLLRKDFSKISQEEYLALRMMQ
jgi:hypothetical protein